MTTQPLLAPDQRSAIDALRTRAFAWLLTEIEVFHTQHPELRLRWSFEVEAVDQMLVYQDVAEVIPILQGYFARQGLASRVVNVRSALLIWEVRAGQQYNQAWSFDEIAQLTLQPAKLWQRAAEIIAHFARAEHEPGKVR